VRFPAYVAVALLCLVAAACGGNDEAESPTTTRERYVPVVPEQISEGTGPCGLLTQAEVSSAVGLPADPGAGQQSGGGGSCSWTLRGSGAQAVNLVTLALGGDPYQQTLSTAPKPIEPVDGVGDRAFIATDTVWAFKGPRVVAVQVTMNQPIATRRQYATKLAQSAIGRA
jgi:hypothetical protein